MISNLLWGDTRAWSASSDDPCMHRMGMWWEILYCFWGNWKHVCLNWLEGSSSPLCGCLVPTPSYYLDDDAWAAVSCWVKKWHHFLSWRGVKKRRNDDVTLRSWENGTAYIVLYDDVWVLMSLIFFTLLSNALLVKCLLIQHSANHTNIGGAWIHETKFSLTKISLFERLTLQAPLTKEGLKLFWRLKFFSKGNPTKLCFSSLSSFNLIEICGMPHLLAGEGEKERGREIINANLLYFSLFRI
jgi:hypothetical protein